MITLRPALESDRAFWLSIDRHTTEQGFSRKVSGRLGFVVCEDGEPCGLLHYCALWDNLPFLNLLFLLPEARGHGAGRRAMALWEDEMRALGYSMALTSTQSDEDAQLFYRRIGYRDCGVLLLQDCPLAQPPELFLCKTLDAAKGETCGGGEQGGCLEGFRARPDANSSESEVF